MLSLGLTLTGGGGVFDGAARAEEGASLTVSLPEVVLQGIEFTVAIHDPEHTLPPQERLVLTVGERIHEQVLNRGRAEFSGLTSDDEQLIITLRDGTGRILSQKQAVVIPAWYSLLPALVSIGIALLFRQVILALFIGLTIGGWLIYGLTADSFLQAVLDTANIHVLKAVSDSEHMAVVLFCFLIGGMIGIISRNGGTAGIVEHVTRFVKNRRQAQVATASLGLAIFFDDYANSLVVGNTMRKITDAMRISREKLAYIVDSTAAPVSALFLVTTWIGFQVGLIDEAMRPIKEFTESPYSVFINSIAYSFYPILALFYVFLVASTGRDFGPMLRAERRALHDGHLTEADAQQEAGVEQEEALGLMDDAEIRPRRDIPHKALNAVIPLVVLVGATLGGVIYTGLESPDRADGSLREIFGNADSFSAMMWGSLIGCVVAAAISLFRRLLDLEEIIASWYAGVKTMLLAIIILVMAWSLAGINDMLHTGDFLVSALGVHLQPEWLPALVFLVAAFTAFSTGSSWGTMGIMMPLTIPLVWEVMKINGLTTDPQALHLFYSSVAGVLAGAVWGDHCSPLAESTLLSALATRCDLIDHVRTQLPYALLVGFAGILLGSVPVAYGMPWWLAYAMGVVVLSGVHLTLARSPHHLPAVKARA